MQYTRHFGKQNSSSTPCNKDYGVYLTFLVNKIPLLPLVNKDRWSILDILVNKIPLLPPVNKDRWSILDILVIKIPLLPKVNKNYGVSLTFW